jgi:ATP-dependent helicase/nuclease subunit A
VLDAPALSAFFDPARVVKAWNEVPLRSGALHGIVDRLVDDGATLWIVDYKTAPGADEGALLERHGPQLRAYRDAAQALWPGKPVRAGLIATAARRWLELE